MEVVDSINSENLAVFAHTNIDVGSTISSDAYSAYVKLSAEGYLHNAKIFDVNDDSDHLKWLHMIVSNAKAFILGTYHGLDSKHLQMYLDEFCYRFNRRKFKGQLFNRIVNACLSMHKITFTELTA